MPANILNLQDLKVQRVEETEHDYHVYAETKGDAPPCGYCGSTGNVRGHGRNQQKDVGGAAVARLLLRRGGVGLVVRWGVRHSRSCKGSVQV